MVEILENIIHENRLIRRLNDKNGRLYQKFIKSKEVIRPMLARYIQNFPEYTDHSIEHAKTVLEYANYILTDEEINNLNSDEIYILLSACLFHDVGMCVPIREIKKTYQEEFQKERVNNPDLSFEDFIRNMHHKLSYDFILREWQLLDIENYDYAKAIALVAQGHRKVNLLDTQIYEPRHIVRPGRDFVCLPYLASITRIADELDISNIRTPDILLKHFYPIDPKSQEEFEKHRATTIVNIQDNTVNVKAKCSDQLIYNTLNELCNKVQQTLDYCQKVIRNVANFKERQYTLTLNKLSRHIEPIGFIPKDIGFTFDIDNVFRTLVGGKLYGNKYIAIREALQNAIDTCGFKKKIFPDYNPKIIMNLDESNLRIMDNGFGMDDFIVENYFGRLAKSYYQKEDVKEKYDAIAQFGIGVFSYFMICDYFQIRTRLKGKEPLNFSCYNKPHKYFYFTDEISNINEGTEIIFHLNDEVKGELDLNKLEDLLKYYIRFVDIPIVIQKGDKSLTISQEDYAVNIKEDLIRSLKPIYRVLKIEYLSRELDTADYRGICGILIQKNPSNQYNFESFEDKFESGFTFNIAICYKGIFLRNLVSDTLSQLIGKINIKTFQDINLERTTFEDSDFIKNIIRNFEFEVTKKAFQVMRELPNKSRYFQQTQFILDQLNKEDPFVSLPEMDEYYFIKEEIIYCTIRNEEILYISWNELMDNIESLIIINYSGTNLYEFNFFISKLFQISFDDLLFNPQLSLKIIEALKIKEIAKDFFNSKYKILLENRYNLFKQLEKYFLDFKYDIVVFSNEMFSFYIVNTNKYVEKIDYIDYEYPCLKFNENHICTIINSIIFNRNSPIIDYYIKNQEKIEENEVVDDLFDDFFESMEGFINLISVFKHSMENMLPQLDGILESTVNAMKSGDLQSAFPESMKSFKESMSAQSETDVDLLMNPYANMSEEEKNKILQNMGDEMIKMYNWNNDFSLPLTEYMNAMGMGMMFGETEYLSEDPFRGPHALFLEMQKILNDINSRLKTKFTLAKEDFPEWLVKISIDSSILPTIREISHQTEL